MQSFSIGILLTFLCLAMILGVLLILLGIILIFKPKGDINIFGIIKLTKTQEANEPSELTVAGIKLKSNTPGLFLCVAGLVLVGFTVIQAVNLVTVNSKSFLNEKIPYIYVDAKEINDVGPLENEKPITLNIFYTPQIGEYKEVGLKIYFDFLEDNIGEIVENIKYKLQIDTTSYPEKQYLKLPYPVDLEITKFLNQNPVHNQQTQEIRFIKIIFKNKNNYPLRTDLIKENPLTIKSIVSIK